MTLSDEELYMSTTVSGRYNTFVQTEDLCLNLYKGSAYTQWTHLENYRILELERTLGP